MSYLCSVKKIEIMTLAVGTYHFGRHRRYWGIWQVESIINGTSSKHIKDVCTYEDAVRETYHLNGWHEPKKISRKY